MSFYCDSSLILGQLYPGPRRIAASREYSELVQEAGFIPITLFTRTEVIQSLRFEAWRHRNDRTKGLPPNQVADALNLFLADIGTGFQMISVDWNLVFRKVEDLSRSTPDHGWGTLDMIHVASALVIGAERFYSYDQLQSLLANREGLQTPLIEAS